jgi:hypothetical protein
MFPAETFDTFETGAGRMEIAPADQPELYQARRLRAKRSFNHTIDQFKHKYPKAISQNDLSQNHIKAFNYFHCNDFDFSAFTVHRG